jgi:hypothetical protein
MPYADQHPQRGCDCDRCEARRQYQRIARGGLRIPPYHTGERLSDAERQAKYRATADTRRAAERDAIRQRWADYQPADVRTYGTSPSGIDYDAAIQAAAVSSVPYPESPNRGTKR